MGKIYTAINCMDGRVQLPAIHYLKDRFGVDYIDIITEPGPNLILANATDVDLVQSIERRVRISLEHHHSCGIAVIGHHDCAGNPAPELEQEKHTMAAVSLIRTRFKQVPVIGLWINQDWEVSEVQECSGPASASPK